MGEVLELKFDTRMQCGGCGQMRDLHEWYWRKGPPLRLARNVCKECARKHQNEAQKQRYNADPEWREKYREYQKQYALKKKGDPRWRLLCGAAQERYKERHPQIRSEISKRYRQKHPGKRLLLAAKGRAKKRGTEFALTYEWIQERYERGICEVTGLPFVENTTNGRCGPFSPSIDRIDSSIGYVPSNCRLVLWGLNMALSEWGEEIYAAIASAYLERHRG